MKIKELINKLSSFDTDLEVLFVAEEKDQPKNQIVFDIESVEKTQVEKTRDKQGRACLTYGKRQTSQTVVIVQITDDL